MTNSIRAQEANYGSKKVAKKAPPAKKTAPKLEGLRSELRKPSTKSKFPSSAPTPTARPLSPADHKLVRSRTASASPASKVSNAGASRVSAFGRDRFGPSAKAAKSAPSKLYGYRESEVDSLKKMRRDRLGSGQR